MLRTPEERRRRHAEYMRNYYGPGPKQAERLAKKREIMARQKARDPNKVRELDRERGRRYRAKNPERVRELARARVARYAATHPERVRQIQAKYRETNAEACLARKAARRARESFRDLSLEEKAGVKDIYRKCREMSQMTGVQHHVDHIIPIAKGGEHRPRNLQILTAAKNWSKGAS